ncbi:hypothetical protein JGU66_23535 [Myxococcaceae bacterium JPH2]|nr:hypothetical protein [Myxococcaceae bacterium JPH2]
MRARTMISRWLRASGLGALVTVAAVGCTGPQEELDFGPQTSVQSTGLGQSVATFRDVLGDAGQWVNLPSVGWVWQPDPAVVGTDFVPYVTGGQWMESDRGWVFQTQWDWGWAPFHYGRWFVQPGRGWVWWPDEEWAPAWVDWRWGDGFVGWEPVPPPGLTIAPFWSFVSLADLVQPNLFLFVVPRARVVELLPRTAPVGERVHGFRGAWTRGPSPRDVEQATGQPPPRAPPTAPPTALRPRPIEPTPALPGGAPHGAARTPAPARPPPSARSARPVTPAPVSPMEPTHPTEPRPPRPAAPAHPTVVAPAPPVEPARPPPPAPAHLPPPAPASPPPPAPSHPPSSQHTEAPPPSHGHSASHPEGHRPR